MTMLVPSDGIKGHFPVYLILFNFTEFSKKHTYNFYS